MNRKVEYPNWLSKMLLGPWFERQYIVPVAPPRPVELFLKWLETSVMQIDTFALEIDRPIFVIGLPRSGTTMLQNIICSHPNVAYMTNGMYQFRSCFCAAESLRRFFGFNARGERYLADSIIVDAESPADSVAFWSEWIGEDPHSLEYRERRIQDYSASDVERLYESIRKIIWCFGGGSRRFFSKNPGLLPHIPLLKDLFPDARFIHIVRDARMCANSLVKLCRLDREQLMRVRRKGRHGIFDESAFIPYPRLPGLAGNVERYGAEDIRTTASLWSEGISFVNAHRSGIPNFYEVRYEDILADPPGETAKIIQFCELSETGAQVDEFRRQIAGVGVVHHKNQYGNFELVESICSENMKRYGYL